jgi:SAM-dependent methyltransferase
LGEAGRPTKVALIAVDRDRASLRALRTAMERLFPGAHLDLVAGDFRDHLPLPPLDGILAANAIHFVREQTALLRQWREYLKPGSRLLVVEYDAAVGNRWVPHPLSFAALGPVARAAGFSEPVLIGARPSRFLGRIYAAVATSLADDRPVDARRPVPHHAGR